MAYEPPVEGKLVASDLLAVAYPVGSLYMSTVDVSPASFLGGTWVRIEDCMLLAAGSTYSAGSTGGSATQTISTSNIPQHSHSFSTTTASGDSHTHSWSATSGGSGNHQHTAGVDFDGASGSSAYRPVTWGSHSASSPGSSVGNHTHTVSGTSGNQSASHTHSVSMSSGSTGSGNSFSILPPYISVYVWERTA